MSCYRSNQSPAASSDPACSIRAARREWRYQFAREHACDLHHRGPETHVAIVAKLDRSARVTAHIGRQGCLTSPNDGTAGGGRLAGAAGGNGRGSTSAAPPTLTHA